VSFLAPVFHHQGAAFFNAICCISILTNTTENEFCTMCMVRNANEHPLGDPLAVNEYFCNIAKLNKKTVLECKCNLVDSQSMC